MEDQNALGENVKSFLKTVTWTISGGGMGKRLRAEVPSSHELNKLLSDDNASASVFSLFNGHVIGEVRRYDDDGGNTWILVTKTVEDTIFAIKELQLPIARSAFENEKTRAKERFRVIVDLEAAGLEWV